MAIEPNPLPETATGADAVSIFEVTVTGCLLLARGVIVATATRVLIAVFTWPACA